MIRFIAFISLFFLSSLDAAVQCEGDSCEASKEMTFMGFDIYHFLYSINEDGIEKLTLTYKRDIPKEKNIEKTLEKFAQNNPADAKRYRPLLDEWNSHLIDVKEGSVYEVVVDPGGTTMFIDKKRIFHTDEVEFGHMYINMWCGSNPADDDLKVDIQKARNQCFPVVSKRPAHFMEG